MNELMMFQNLMSGMIDSSGVGWLRVALLVGLFGVFIFAPERIKYPTIFRWACGLLALSVIVPPFVQMGLSAAGQGLFNANAYGGPDPDLRWLVHLPQVTGPLLLGLSILLTFTALAPQPIVRPSSSPNRPHPLDD